MNNLFRISIYVICFLALTHPVEAQLSQPETSDALGARIQEMENMDLTGRAQLVQQTHKTSLLSLYKNYVTLLELDVMALQRMRATISVSDTSLHSKITESIEGLLKEQAAITQKIQTLAAELQRREPSQAKDYLPCSCQEFKGRKKQLPVGTIWCGKESELNLEDLAKLSAPILWFSPDEPLPKPIPETLPGDKQSTSAVVYYRISNLTLSPEVKIRGDNRYKFDYDSALDLTKIRGLTLRYYFYYSQDRGFNKHPHDLESIRLEIQFTPINLASPRTKDLSGVSPSKIYVANISRVIGAAHGVTWYYNELDTDEDTSLPITILVEEGKHASSPDKNADGHYSPGYDVTRRYSDAWGVRDLIGTGELGEIGYEGSMTKPRNPKHMIRVQFDEPECLLKPYKGLYENENVLMTAPDTYELRAIKPGTPVHSRTKTYEKAFGIRAQMEENETQAKEESKKDTEKIEAYMKREKFQEEPKQTHGDNFFQKAIKKGLGIERSDETLDALTLAYRYDGGHGFSISPPIGRYQINVFGGYAVPRVNLIRTAEGNRFSLEALYTPSAARRADWYVTAGSEWLRVNETRDYKAKFVSEGGFKFRFNFKDLLVGFRFGLRANGLKRREDSRVIFEFGPGAF